MPRGDREGFEWSGRPRMEKRRTKQSNIVGLFQFLLFCDNNSADVDDASASLRTKVRPVYPKRYCLQVAEASLELEYCRRVWVAKEHMQIVCTVIMARWVRFVLVIMSSC